MNAVEIINDEEKENLVVLTSKLKEANAAKYDFNVRAIGEAARRNQNKDLTVSRESK